MRMTPVHKILFLFFFLYASNTDAQQDLKSFNLFGQANYFIKGEVQTGNIYKFTLFESTDPINPADETKSVTFTLRPLTKETFIQNLFISYDVFKKKVKAPDNQLPIVKNININQPPTDSLDKVNYQKLEAEASRLFYMFIAGSIVLEDLNTEPIAGEICFVKDFKILRRDFNRQSLKHETTRLWKVYKSDRKLAKPLLDTVKLDNLRNIDKKIEEHKLEEDEKLKYKELLDTISKQFSFEELFDHLNKREVISKKDNEFLQKEANTRRNRYDEVVNNLKLITLNVEEKTAFLKRDSSVLVILDSLISKEQRRKDFYQKFEEAFNNAENQVKKLYSSKEIEEIYTLYKNIEFDSGAEKEDTTTVKTKLLEFEKSMKTCTTCMTRDSERGFEREAQKSCRNWNKTINLHISTGKNLMNEAIQKEKLALQNVSNDLVKTRTEPDSLNPNLDSLALKKDSIAIDQNISTLNEIINIYNDDIPKAIAEAYTLIAKFCEHADTLAALNKQQLQLTNQLKLHKNTIQPILINRKDNPVFSGTLVFRPENLSNQETTSATDSVKLTLTAELESKRGLTKGEIEKKIGDLGHLKSSVREQEQELMRREDELVFKDFTVESITMEINEGFIENILMVGKVSEYADKYGHIKIENGQVVPSSRKLKFENSSPIGFSRKLDFDALKGKKLYTRGGGRTQYETYLEDVISTYIQTHQVGRRDYSPANQIVTFKAGTALCQELKKDATYRLFEAKIFSDFVGLDDTEPNGLIQTEISKRINLLTNRRPFQFFTLGGLRNEWNAGMLSFFEPTVTLSKIENNNRFLALDSKERFINNISTPIKFTSTLALKQFENFSAGATANLLLLDMPNIKSTFYLNWGFRFGRTAVRDSILTSTNGINEFGVNTFDHHPEMVWNIYADERYGFSMTWQHHWFYLRDNRFEQVSNTAFFQDQVINTPKDSRQFNTIRILTTLAPTNDKGKLFFRYTYNWQQGFWRTGFHQAQVGYSFYLLGRQAE